MHLRSTIFVTLVLILLANPSLRADSMGSSVDKTNPKILNNMGRGQKATGVDPRTRYISLINEWAPQYNLDANLVEAVVAVESNYDRFAVSNKGAQGLMQLIPATAKRFGVRDAFDAADNIRGGVRYLNFLMSYFQGNLEHVLAAYNSGEQTVVRYHGVPPYPETQKYIRKVTSLYHALNSQAAPTPVEWQRGKFRLKRVILPNGSILFTNTE
jgi:soluble lytic murein transglycosylase-like protein